MEKADTQLAMNICAGQESTRVDAALNGIFQQLLSAARDEPDAVEKIRSAERAWIVYRDAYLEATYPAKDKQAAYGSIFPMEFNLILAELTQQHMDALKRLLKRYGDSN